jgi:uncharacterized delta-60 repeat protein
MRTLRAVSKPVLASVAAVLVTMSLGGMSDTWAADGDIDTSFGSAGFIMLNSLMDHAPPLDTQSRSVAIDPNGRIVIVGAAQHINIYGDHTDANFLILRLTSDGSVDTTFASDDSGYRLINFDLAGIGTQAYDLATDVAIQSDAKIAVIGNAFFNYAQSHFAAVRVDDAGALDPTFGGSGMVHFGAVTAFSNWAQSLRVDNAGNLVFSGVTTHDSGGNSQGFAAVARLTPSGSLDSSFNYGFTQEFSLAPPAQTALDSGAASIGLDGDGRILVAGNYDTSNISGAAVQRLTTDGLLDTSFAGNAPAPIPQPYFNVRAIHVESKGSFVVCGIGFDTQGYVYFARFLPDGAADTSFGTNGIAAFPFNSVGAPNFIAPTKRGGWLMAGLYAQEGAFIAKVLANGQPDTTLNGTGFASVLYQPNTLLNIAKPALTADGKLIVVGTLPEAAAAGVGTIGVMRILADYDTLFVGNFEATQ